MELGAIFLLLGVLLGVIVFVARPLAGRGSLTAHQNQEISSALAERERLLNALQELDFDQKLGKIPADEYPAQRALLVEKGAAVLRRLDALQAAPAAERSAAKPAARKPARSDKLSDEEVEDLIAMRRAARRDRTAGFCPACGRPVLQSDQFCPSCGRALR